MTTQPTLSFGDGDTGFYQDSRDEIRIVAGGMKAPKNYKKVHVARRRLAKKRYRSFYPANAMVVGKIYNDWAAEA